MFMTYVNLLFLIDFDYFLHYRSKVRINADLMRIRDFFKNIKFYQPNF